MLVKIVITLGIALIIFMLKPLVQMLLLKLKHGNRVIIQWYPFQGFIPQLINSYKKYNDMIYHYKIVCTKYPQGEVILINTTRGWIMHTFFQISHIKFILTNPKLYHKVNHIPFGERFLYKGLLFQEDDEWKLARKIFSKSFEFTQLKAKIPFIKNAVKQTFQLPTDTPIDIIQYGSQIAGEVITQTFLSNDSKEFNREVYDAMFGVLTSSKNKWITSLRRLIFRSTRNMPKQFIFSFEKPYLIKLEEVMGKIKEFIEQRMKINVNPPQDFLQDFIDEMKSNPKLTIDEAIQQYMILLFAGIDTTSNMFGSCCYVLSTHQEIQDKLRKNIQEVIGNYNDLDSNNINKIAYLNAFIDECFRMHTPAFQLVERMAQKDHYIGEYFIKKDTIIALSFISVNYDPKYYEDPFKFNPDRWLQKKDLDPFVFVPFSSGQRNCIGQHLSLIELKSMLIYILLNYKIEKAIDQVKWRMKFVYTINENKFIKLQKLQ